MKRHFSVHREAWAAAAPFRITGRTYLEFNTVVVELGVDAHVGRGEAMPIHYLGDSVEAMCESLEGIRAELEAGADREALLRLLPPGGARNAVDAALWDLEARTQGRPAWELAQTGAKPVETVYTIGIESEPEAMGEKAANAPYPLLKIKLDGDRPVERVAAIRRRRPDARLVVDANQGWTFEQLKAVAAPLKDLGVLFIEQPLPRGHDAMLASYTAPLLLCADESCQHLEELEPVAERYQMINIKLDKCGGLTAGLALVKAARTRKMGVMVGCMGGTSLGVAPAFLLAQLCDFVDIDAPLLLKADRPNGLEYRQGQVSIPAGCCWGR
ncbi:MAG TPA: dipeptide epimerase [Solimonas sp.]